MKKGSYVKFKFRENEYTGLIISGGKVFTVRFIFEGSLVELKGMPQQFTETDAPKMDTSSAMDAYTVSGYKEAGGDETIRFECTLLKNGKKIARVSNDGYGGCNEYCSFTSSYDDIKQFHADAKQWAKDHDITLYETADTWFDWYTIVRAEFITADAYLDDFKSAFAK